MTMVVPDGVYCSCIYRPIDQQRTNERRRLSFYVAARSLRPLSLSGILLTMAAALLVAAQPHLTAADYESAATLYAALNASLRRLERSASARQSGHTLVVFPELVGTWLAVSGHHAAASSSTSAMVGMLLEQPLAFAFELLRSLVRDWWHRSLLGHMQRAAFALAAPRVWRSWRLVFATLALQHGCWIVAGSAYLPRLEFAQCTHEQRQRRVDHPHDRATLAVPDAESQPRVTRDGLYNVSVLFGPDGRAHSASYKVHLIPDEREFADAAPLEWLRPTRCAPFGLVGTIICADSWHDTPYTQLQRCADAEQEPMAVLAVPTYLTPVQVRRSLDRALDRSLTRCSELGGTLAGIQLRSHYATAERRRPS